MKILSNKPTITRKELEGVLDCLINEELSSGEQVKALETSLCTLTDRKFCLAVNSLTAAYHLVFSGLELGPGDEVILPDYSSPAALSALSLTGATAVPADCGDGMLCPSSDIIKSLITDKTKAVVICHTFGFPAPTDELADVNVPVIEDISHFTGCEYNGFPAGKTGAFAVASFAPEMMITTGNGGAVLTNNPRAFSIMRDLRNGEDCLNLDYTMTDLQGAMGSSQLLKLNEFLKRRKEIAARFCDAARLTSHRLPFPYSPSFGWQTFPIVFDAAEENIQKYWKKNGVETARPVSRALHEYLGLKGMDYPNADRLTKKLYTVPLYPTLTKKEIEQIARLIAGFM